MDVDPIKRLDIASEQVKKAREDTAEGSVLYAKLSLVKSDLAVVKAKMEARDDE